MKLANTAARLVWLLLAAIAITATGCGGCSNGATQEEMMRAAMRRSGGDDEDKPPSESVAMPSDAAPAPSDATEDPHSQRPRLVEQDEMLDSNHTAFGPSPSVPQGGNREEEVDGDDTGSTNDAAPLTPNSHIMTLVEPVSTLEERRERSIENMQVIAQGLVDYAEENGSLPWTAIFDEEARPLLSWRVAILPYVGYQSLYDEFHLDEEWDSEHNLSLLPMIPPFFQDPQRIDQTTCYLLPVGTSTAFPGGRRTVLTLRIEDGLEDTILLFEADSAASLPWTKPGDLNLNRDNTQDFLGGHYPDGFLAAWGDGSVRRVIPGTANNDVYAMTTVDGGEAVERNRVSRIAESAIQPHQANAGECRRIG